MVCQQRLTAGQIIERYRQMPEMRKLVEDCYLDEDLLHAARRFSESEEFSTVLEYLDSKAIRAPALVLDLGGGNGVASLAYNWAGYRVVLAEPDCGDVVGLGAIAPRMKQAEYNIGLCAAIGENLPFPDGTFDIVYTRQVLHHTSELSSVCMEIHRVLRSNGLFIAAREHVISKPGDLNVFLQNHPVHRFTGAENAHLLRDYRAALSRAGFRQVEVLGPWESVVNYYPMTRSQHVDRCCEAISKYFGLNIGRRLSSLGLVLRAYGRYATMKDRTPGRLYSFLARR